MFQGIPGNQVLQHPGYQGNYWRWEWIFNEAEKYFSFNLKIVQKMITLVFFRVSVHPYSPATPSEGHFPIYLLTLMCSGLWKVLEKYHEKINIHEWTTKIPWVALLGPDSKDNEELICKHAWFDKNPCGGRGCSNDIQCVKGKWENKGLKSLSISLN